MKTRSIVMTMLLCFVGLAAGFAENPNMGTWKLNEAKSKLAAGMRKNTMVAYSADGDTIKVVTDGTDGKGNPMHTDGPANSTAKTTLFPAIPLQTRGRTTQSTSTPSPWLTRRMERSTPADES